MARHSCSSHEFEFAFSKIVPLILIVTPRDAVDIMRMRFQRNAAGAAGQQHHCASIATTWRRWSSSRASNSGVAVGSPLPTEEVRVADHEFWRVAHGNQQAVGGDRPVRTGDPFLAVRCQEPISFDV